MLNDHRILSRPLRVHWAGWETTTHRLQQAGWQLSADQDVFNNRLRVAMFHNGYQMRAVSEMMDFEYHMAIDRHYEYLPDMCIQMRHVGREIHVHEIGGPCFGAMHAIDATPSFVERRITRIEDLAHFSAPLVKTREIIIPQDSVPELLERILKLQQPARTDRVREQMRESPQGFEVMPQQRMEAQIISLAA